MAPVPHCWLEEIYSDYVAVGRANRTEMVELPARGGRILSRGRICFAIVVECNYSPSSISAQNAGLQWGPAPPLWSRPEGCSAICARLAFCGLRLACFGLFRRLCSWGLAMLRTS